MRAVEIETGDGHILYDADSVAHVDESWFEPRALAARRWLRGGARGRGRVHFFRYDDTDYVLRHYRRGGWIARWLDDRYLWSGLARTRAWREWRLLAQVVALELPAPWPIAARVARRGVFYSADLITLRSKASISLAETLSRGALNQPVWREIGRVVRAFHAAGVYHADLNAHNILVDGQSTVMLIDFDNARFKRAGGSWQAANLARLLRSLRKLKRLDPEFHFSEHDFQALRECYYMSEA